MILCVNLNTAIDKTLVVDNFQLNGIYRPREVLALPGGKGCNVARVLKALGSQPVVTGWVGGHAGRFIDDGLRAEGIQTAFAASALESRECISILDPVNGTVSEVYENGRPVAEAELEQFMAIFRASLPRCEAVTLSGSVPPGVPRDIYAQLITLANEAGVRILLDSSGDTLRLGIAGRPFLVKPNEDELAALLGAPVEALSVEHVAAVAQDVAHRYTTSVVVSLGAQGAVAAHDGRAYHARPPQIDIVSAVGSGDSMLAGLVHALVQRQPFEDALRLGVAAGAANALVLGAGRVRHADIMAILPRVQVRML